MANPKHKISRARRDKRRSHLKLTPPNLSTCPQCQEPKRPHMTCLNCGMYKGRAIIGVEEG